MKKGGGRRTGFRIIAVTVIVICAILGISKYRLEKRYEALAKERAGLETQIEDEEERTREIEEYSIYIKTKKFIKDLANSVMGLVDPDSVIIKEGD